MKKFSHATRFAHLLSATALTFVITGQAATAQDATSASAQPEGADEIIVTAQKRQENAQDVPKSVSVASQVQLQKAGVNRLAELSQIAVSITDTNQSQNSRAPGIRGISSVANSIGVQSQTGIIVDDIPQSTFSTLANELGDVERVEVFAGPQSTLSGRNAAGGIINIVTRNPSARPTGEVNITQTTDHQTRVTGYVSAPLTDKLGFSLSGVYNDWDGAFRNRLQGNRRVGGYDTVLVRGKLRWEPVDDLTITATGFYVRTNRTSPPVFGGGAYILANPNDTYLFDTRRRTFAQLYPGNEVGRGNRSIYSAENGHSKNEDKGGTLRIDYDAGSIGTISSLTSYTRSTQPRTDVLIGAPTDSIVIAGRTVTDFNAYTNVDTKYWTQELRLASSGSGPLTYLVGAIYTDSDVSQPYLRPQVFTTDWDRTTRIKSAAAFGRVTLKVTDRNSITGGLRYQHDKIGYSWQFNRVLTTDPFNLSRGKSSYGFVSGEISAKHEFNDDVNVYATYSFAETGKAYDTEDRTAADRIDAAGNVTALGTPLQPLASEKVNNVEIGLKSRLFDRRLTLNINGFYAKYSNYQIQTVDRSCSSCVPVNRLYAIGGVETKGVEAAANFNGISGLNLGANLAYTDTVITGYPGNTVLEGNLLPFANKWKANVSADYTIELDSAPFDINFGAFYRYQSRTFFNLNNNIPESEAPYSIVNLTGSLQFKNRNYEIQFFVNNLFNKHYYSYRAAESFFSPAAGSARASEVLGVFDRNSFRYGGVRLTAKF